MSSNGGNVQEGDSRTRFPNVLANMEKNLERELRSPPPSPETSETKRTSFATREPLIIIADAVKRLVWDDNEKLAQMISRHLQNGGEPASMAAAIQRAADDLINEDSSSRQ